MKLANINLGKPKDHIMHLSSSSFNLQCLLKVTERLEIKGMCVCVWGGVILRKNVRDFVCVCGTIDNFRISLILKIKSDPIGYNQIFCCSRKMAAKEIWKAVAMADHFEKIQKLPDPVPGCPNFRRVPGYKVG